MSIEKSIARIQKDIEYQNEKLALFLEMQVLFNGIEFPEKVNIYFNRYSNGKIYAEFSPGYEDSAEKNLQPLVHAISQKFQQDFIKALGYDDESLTYSAEFDVESRGEVKRLAIRISGVVPKTCKIVETVRELSEEELETARAEALANIQTTKIERKIICD